MSISRALNLVGPPKIKFPAIVPPVVLSIEATCSEAVTGIVTDHPIVNCSEEEEEYYIVSL